MTIQRFTCCRTQRSTRYDLILYSSGVRRNNILPASSLLSSPSLSGGKTNKQNMLLRSPLSSPSLPYASSHSTRPPAQCVCTILYLRSFSRAREEKRECLTMKSGALSQVYNYGTMDFENKQNLHWSAINRRIITARREGKDASTVLESWDQLERRLSKWELVRVARELRKFRHSISALEIYQWMVEQGERFTVRSSDMAVHLDLIGKVRGPIAAKEFFSSLPDPFKDKRTYCSLLNVYTQYKLKEEAEAIFYQMRTNGHDTDSLPYNVMMTLYLDLQEHATVANLMQEMKERNIKLDVYSYNIWIVNAAAMQDVDQMESVLQVMQLDNVNANWSIHTTLANMYIKLGLLDKAEACLREAEEKITGRDREAFLFFITIYANIGKKEDLYRIWDWFKSSFSSPLNTGYKTMIRSLLKLGDVAGAESLYEEWITNAGSLDPKISQLLMGWYCWNGLTDKAKETMEQLLQRGGKPNQYLWSTLAEGCLNENRLEESVSYFELALSSSGYDDWKPKTKFVEDLFEVCKQREQTEVLDQVVSILEKRGLDQVEPYRGFMQQCS